MDGGATSCRRYGVKWCAPQAPAQKALARPTLREAAFLRSTSTLRRARSRAQVALGSRCAARGLPCCDGHVRVQRALGALGVPVRPLRAPPTRFDLSSQASS